MEQAVALESAERALRLAIREVLGDKWATATGHPDMEELRKTQKREQRKRPGVVVSQDLLDFTYTSALEALILGNEEKFDSIFPDMTVMRGFLKFLSNVRNTIAHNRNLVTYERDLLAGISGEIRNLVALYRTRNPARQFYPTIEAVTDNFGRQGMVGMRLPDGVNDAIRLEVGDRVTLDCSAWDPIPGRHVEWMLESAKHDMRLLQGNWLPVATGTNVTLKYEVTEADVGESFVLIVFMRNSGRFYRDGNSVADPHGFDASASLYFAVNPPL